jgi:hypothetical protein
MINTMFGRGPAALAVKGRITRNAEAITKRMAILSIIEFSL